MSGPSLAEDDTLDRVYGRRFSDDDARKKVQLWRRDRRVSCSGSSPAGAVVLDLACDRGDFIRNVAAGERWATDIRDMSRVPAAPTSGSSRATGSSWTEQLPNDHFDLVFMSNYLEHLPSGDAVIAQLDVARRLLKRGGRVLVLQPNIRLVGSAYWDFIDHKVALTEKSLVEAGELAGLETGARHQAIPAVHDEERAAAVAAARARLPRVPAAWRLLGKQTLYVGRRP